MLVVDGREEGKDHRYSVEHHGQHLYILTNKDNSVNSKLMRTSGTTQPRGPSWVDSGQEVLLPFPSHLSLCARVCMAMPLTELSWLRLWQWTS